MDTGRPQVGAIKETSLSEGLGSCKYQGTTDATVAHTLFERPIKTSEPTIKGL